MIRCIELKYSCLYISYDFFSVFICSCRDSNHDFFPFPLDTSFAPSAVPSDPGSSFCEQCEFSSYLMHPLSLFFKKKKILNNGFSCCCWCTRSTLFIWERRIRMKPRQWWRCITKCFPPCSGGIPSPFSPPL